MAVSYLSESSTPGFEALIGSAFEIREKLKEKGNEQVVALKLEHSNEKYAVVLADAVRLIVPMVLRTLATREKATLEQLVELLVPQVSPPDHLVMEAQMNADARSEVLTTSEWVTASKLSEIAGFSGQNASAQPNKWKREGKIFALRQNGSDYYPDYGLDPENGYRPVKGLAPILAVFGEALDDWEVAIWFASLNSFLGGAKPKDLLSSAPERVLAAAEDEMAGVRHG